MQSDMPINKNDFDPLFSVHTRASSPCQEHKKIESL